MKVLEIDDNDDIIKFVEMIVQSMGHEFTSTHDGREGVKLIEDNTYDVVLLDLSMPGFSGIDVLDALAEKNLIRKQKIVLFTASVHAGFDMESIMSRGVHSYIPKPIDVDMLMQKINELETEGMAH